MEGSGHGCMLGMSLYIPEETEENYTGTSEKSVFRLRFELGTSQMQITLSFDVRMCIQVCRLTQKVS
jgi:hypothetical protein